MSVHKSTPHDAAFGHVTGSARYVDDIPVPANALHLAFGLSQVAHGVIKSIDLDAVRSADGVIAVLQANDLPYENDVSPSAHDEPLLATDRVHYIGQPIFVVAATSHLAARKAARLGQIDIAPLPACLTIEDAMAANSRFEDGPRIYGQGDPDSALKKAKHTLTNSIKMGGQEHFYLEGQAALALPADNGDMVVHSSTQHPSEIQHKVAEALGKPFHAVRVEVRRMGGGFGGKESQGNALAVACAIVADRTGRPCKMRYDRDDDMMITGKRHDFRIDYSVGFDDSGKISGITFDQFTRCGWAQDLSLPVADRAMLHSDNAYYLPNIRITSHRLKTNTQSATAFRGFGGPQGMMGIEAAMDQIAQYLGLDALDVRLANTYADFDKTAGQTTPYGMIVKDGITNALIAKLVETSNYHIRCADISSFNAKNNILKKGISLTPIKFGISFTLTHLNQAGALVHVYSDGSIMLNHGGTEMGQGLFQKVAQVAASRFDVPLEMVKITATDTGKVPNTSATAASSGSDLNGMAVADACDQIKDKMRECLAQTYGDKITFKDGHVQAGDTTLTFAQAAQHAYLQRVSLSATGFYKTPDVAWDRIKGKGQPFFYFAYGAAVTEVVIDTLTGENRILRTDILHDAGASLNPDLDVGQIEGGYVQGAGWLTTEELVWDDTGRLRTHAPATYKIPACSDRPDIFNVALWDAENPAETIYKSKAVGEPPFMLGMSAFFALQNAVNACGDKPALLNAPATAEEIARAVQDVRT